MYIGTVQVNCLPPWQKTVHSLHEQSGICTFWGAWEEVRRPARRQLRRSSFDVPSSDLRPFRPFRPSLVRGDSPRNAPLVYASVRARSQLTCQRQPCRRHRACAIPACRRRAAYRFHQVCASPVPPFEFRRFEFRFTAVQAVPALPCAGDSPSNAPLIPRLPDVGSNVALRNQRPSAPPPNRRSPRPRQRQI